MNVNGLFNYIDWVESLQGVSNSRFAPRVIAPGAGWVDARARTHARTQFLNQRAL